MKVNGPRGRHAGLQEDCLLPMGSLEGTGEVGTLGFDIAAAARRWYDDDDDELEASWYP